MKHSLLKFLIYSVLCIISITGFTQHTAAQDQPRLVIGIMVDGLQQKHVDLLWNFFDSNGLKKIVEQGSHCQNVHYDIISAGNAADVANVMTGTTPYYNGITGSRYFDRQLNEEVSIIEDDDQVGIGTKLSVSPHNLVSSTIMDELVLANPTRSKCYAVAINAEEALMMGGHTAKSVAWVDDVNEKWITTGFYSEGLSKWADEMNTSGIFQQHLSQNWEPYYAINTYFTAPNIQTKNGSFLYNPRSKVSKNSTTSILKNTPAVNSLVADLALKIISEEQMGTDKYTDMLMLEFTVRTPFEKSFSLQSAEKEDIYLRLDKEIQKILQKVDSKIGLDKTVVFMFGNQTAAHSPTELGEKKIPAGYFNADRTLALLSTYLMAVYGPKKWILGYYGKNIYLNRKLIEDSKINMREMQENIAEFMLDFEGIKSVYTSQQIMNTGGNEYSIMERIHNSSYKRNRGDIIISLLPGWLEVDDKGAPVGESNALLTYTPVYFYGWKIPAQKIDESYQTTDIAPTISKILNIPMPNACIGKPIKLIP